MVADPAIERISDALVAQRVQAAEELAASTARALADSPSLRFRDHVLHDGLRPGGMLAPHLRVDARRADTTCLRGAADGVALQMLHCDADAHATRRPADPVRRFVFDQLEQFRVESLAPRSQPGLQRNLRHRFHHWALEAHDGGLTGTATGLLLHTVGEVARARINNDPPPLETERVTEAPRYALAPLIGCHLAALRRHRHDQIRYGEHAITLADKVAELVGGEPRPPRSARNRGERALAALLVGGDGGDQPPHTAHEASTSSRHGRLSGYRTFTTDYDLECRAGDLVRRELLEENRARLDELVARTCPNRNRLTRLLVSGLTTPTTEGWDHGKDSGRIDGRRLPALVTTPDERRVFRDERIEPVADAHVTLLLDCSGSMKVYASYVAILADVLARTLEEIDVPCAVLGFTTRSWNGGRARRTWRRAGCPESPGRVAERLHLVFSDESRPWRRSRRDVAALFKPDLFREGLDGEALAWAVDRTTGSAYRRRVVLVLSDGGPAESATDGTNDAGLLDRHLIATVEAAGRAGVEVIGLAFGSDLSAFYAHSLMLGESLAPTAATFHRIATILGPLAR